MANDQATDDIDSMGEDELRAEVERLRKEAPVRAYGRSGTGPGGGIRRLTNEANGGQDFGEFQQDFARRYNGSQTGPMSHRGGPDAPTFNEYRDYAAGQLGRHLTKRLLGFQSRLRDGMERAGVDVEALRQELEA